MNQAPHYVESSYKLFDSKHDITWCFGKNTDGIEGMDLSQLKRVRLFNTIKGNAGTYRLQGIKEVAKETNFDACIIIGEPKLLDTWSLPRLFRKYNPKAMILFWSHGWYGKESFAKKIIKKIYFRQADHLLLYGNYARKLMIKEGFDKEKLSTIHNALDYNNQKTIYDSLKPSDIYKEHFKNDNPVLLFIGRLTSAKRLDLLLDATGLLKKKGKEYNIVLIGDGDNRKELETLSSEAGIKNQVWFYGASYDENINAQMIYNADVCVSPGNVGLTAIHAMSYGCPVITHSNFPMQGPEFEAIKEGVTGAFIDYNSVESLTSTIEQWFEQHRSDRETIRQECRYEIDNYWTPEYELNILNNALKKHDYR